MKFLDRILGASGDAPHSIPGDSERVAAVQRVLEELRPMLALDGGDVELLEVAGGRVHVRLVGACTSCSLQDTTLEGALVPRLRDELPWFERLAVEP